MQEAKSYLDKWFRNGLKNQISLSKTKEFSTIISESDPVDMEAAETGFNLSLTEQVHNGRPFYRNSDGWDLYSQEDGTWAASYIVGYSTPMMRSTTTAVKPHLCQHWQYRYYDDGFKYKPGDITVTLIFNIPKLECVNV